jgi:hypothetical protein
MLARGSPHRVHIAISFSLRTYLRFELLHLQLAYLSKLFPLPQRLPLETVLFVLLLSLPVSKVTDGKLKSDERCIKGEHLIPRYKR